MKNLLLLLCLIPLHALAATPKVDGTFFASYSLKNDGSAWSWGARDTNTPTNSIDTLPIQIDNLSNITAISRNYFLKDDGTLWYIPSELSDNQAVQKTEISNVTMVASAHTYTLALKSDGTVWGWGDNQQGNLGSGITSYIEDVPVQATGLTGIVKIAVGGSTEKTSFALKSDGTLWAWGGNHSGKFGNGTTCGEIFCGVPAPMQIAVINDVSDISVSDFHTAVLKNDGTVWLTGGANGLTFTQVPSLASVVDISANKAPISCCTYATYAVKADGSVVSISNDGAATVSAVNGLLNIVDATTHGYNVVYVVANDGKMFAWGNNSHGQLGNGTTVSSLTPVEVGVFIPPPTVSVKKIPVESTVSLIALAIALALIVMLVSRKRRRSF